MSGEAGQRRKRIRVACTECSFSKAVEKGGEESAMVIIRHGRETGHKLTTEEVDPE